MNRRPFDLTGFGRWQRVESATAVAGPGCLRAVKTAAQGFSVRNDRPAAAVIGMVGRGMSVAMHPIRTYADGVSGCDSPGRRTTAVPRWVDKRVYTNQEYRRVLDRKDRQDTDGVGNATAGCRHNRSNLEADLVGDDVHAEKRLPVKIAEGKLVLDIVRLAGRERV